MLSAAFAVGQESTFPSKGVQDKHHVAYAFVNATVHPDHRTTIENGTLLIRDGKVVAVGAEVGVPNGAILVDLNGKHIYPSLIDMYADYGVPQAKANKGAATRRSRATNKVTDRGARNWNPALHPELQAAVDFTVDTKAAKAWRKVGFGVVASHRHNGIMRGTGLVALLGEGRTHDNLLVAENAVYHSFQRGVSPVRYPGSLMGAIALLRQTYLDASWYAALPEKTEYNRSLEAVNRFRSLPHIFEVRDYQSALRADRLGDEFGIQYLIKGKGDEYLRLADIKATGAAYILPLTFPKPYEVADPFDAMHVSLGQMKHWELAPGNAFFLDTAGVPFAFTTRGLKDRATMFKQVRKAISYGLPDSMALKALTIQPARLLRIADQVGSLEPGKLANFLITSGPLFAADNKIYENWVRGKRFVLQDKDALDIRGDYDLNINGQLYQLAVTGSPAKPSGQLNAEGDTIKHPASIAYKDRLVSVSVRIGGDSASGLTRLSGKVNYHSGVWDGQARLPDGQWVPWNAIRKKTADAKKQASASDSASYGAVTFPNGAYGFDTLPEAEDLLIINATVWTNTDQGILRKTSVHLRNGKIQAIGQNLVVDGNPEILDAKGRHLTPGIIDEHSHIAISRGVNEGGQAVSAEVRIGDVINAEDINIYRQLAGGVTAAQLLHGSANPVGGQSALIKMRWGQTAEAMKIAGAAGYIKFALGENVKQSNWGFRTGRFPQTRMGVEQVYYDAFTRAREYRQRWADYERALENKKKRDPEPVAPRKDLELEALSEILEQQRFITCHSYVQSEINMLMHVADSMGFIVNTFTHILEGYKVADKMRVHGAGASTFSDWWAYKFEVNDAIPYNGAILNEQGVVTAFNSDDAEMGRRLNQEAGKAIKYGGVSEEDALKFVTLNPAKLLHLDHRMGSIQPGMDADIVLWSAHPLSIYAQAEKTFVDGVRYFDRDRDKVLREALALERNRLVTKMLAAKKGGAATQVAKGPKEEHYHCDTEGGNDED